MKKRKPTNNQIKRRSFLKKGVAASSIFIIPRHVLGGQGYVSPSDKLCLAAIGSGGKGGSDISNASVNGRENVVALCDVDFSQATETLKKFPKAKLYSDFREMLDEEKDIDAVTISTPDHTHASAALYSMDRQKHVYIQKPLTHNIKEARLLTNLARQKKVVSRLGAFARRPREAAPGAGATPTNDGCLVARPANWVRLHPPPPPQKNGWGGGDSHLCPLLNKTLR